MVEFSHDVALFVVRSVELANADLRIPSWRSLRTWIPYFSVEPITLYVTSPQRHVRMSVKEIAPIK